MEEDSTVSMHSDISEISRSLWFLVPLHKKYGFAAYVF
jgi:hypothetical protein